MHGEFGAKSPVIFANKSGVYRCTIENDGQKCYSKSIFITDKGNLWLFILLRVDKRERREYQIHLYLPGAKIVYEVQSESAYCVLLDKMFAYVQHKSISNDLYT